MAQSINFRTLNARTLCLLFFGFSSAIPIVMCGSTLTIRLMELGFTKTAIGTIGLLHIPYSCRLLWGPVIDQRRSPWLHSLGWRKGWTILSLCLTALSLLGIGYWDPFSSPYLFYSLFLLCMLSSGCVYMSGLAYELESLHTEEYPMGSACVNGGYRVGLLAGGAGALYLASLTTWTIAYTFAAFCTCIGALTVYLRPEPFGSIQYKADKEENAKDWPAIFYRGLTAPIKEVVARPHWLSLVVFIAIYRLGDDLIHGFLPAFYVEQGFTKAEIAWAVKLFGMGATLLGVFIGGSLAQTYGLRRSLFAFGALHAASFAGFMVMTHSSGPHIELLCCAVSIEHLTGGMVLTTFIAFLWKMAAKEHAAMQYALCWCVLSIKHALCAAIGGYLVDQVGWVYFFLCGILLFIPGLLWLLRNPVRIEVYRPH